MAYTAEIYQDEACENRAEGFSISKEATITEDDAAHLLTEEAIQWMNGSEINKGFLVIYADRKIIRKVEIIV